MSRERTYEDFHNLIFHQPSEWNKETNKRQKTKLSISNNEIDITQESVKNRIKKTQQYIKNINIGETLIIKGGLISAHNFISENDVILIKRELKDNNDITNILLLTLQNNTKTKIDDHMIHIYNTILLSLNNYKGLSLPYDTTSKTKIVNAFESLNYTDINSKKSTPTPIYNKNFKWHGQITVNDLKDNIKHFGEKLNEKFIQPIINLFEKHNITNLEQALQYINEYTCEYDHKNLIDLNCHITSHRNEYIDKIIEIEGDDYLKMSSDIITQSDKLEYIINGKKVRPAAYKEYIKLSNQDAKICTDIESLFAYNSIKNAFRVVWYDYESMSAPIQTGDFKPYVDKIPTQVSVVITERNNNGGFDIVDKKSIIIDPIKYRWNNKVSMRDYNGETVYRTQHTYNVSQLINALYDFKADVYVVYNKSFENSMNTNLALKFPQYAGKFEEINKKTIDLMTEFKVDGTLSLPNVMIGGQHLYYSIKNIVNHIHMLEDEELSKLVHDYTNDEFGNGLETMKYCLNRFFNTVSDEEWEIKKELLTQYCDYDVTNMIGVYKYIDYLVKNNKY